MHPSETLMERGWGRRSATKDWKGRGAEHRGNGEHSESLTFPWGSKFHSCYYCSMVCPHWLLLLSLAQTHKGAAILMLLLSGCLMLVPPCPPLITLLYLSVHCVCSCCCAEPIRTPPLPRPAPCNVHLHAWAIHGMPSRPVGHWKEGQSKSHVAIGNQNNFWCFFLKDCDFN